VALPKVFTREIPRVAATGSAIPAIPPQTTEKRPTLPTGHFPSAQTLPRPLAVSLFSAPSETERSELIQVPFGRMIPCETVITLESSRIATPVVGLVTEEVWHEGRLVIPAGAEVHGRAAVDRERECIAASGRWTIVWRSGDHAATRELQIEGTALDRERDPQTGAWGEHDGSAGLRGVVLRSDDLREVKLFASTFLSTATAALQDTRTSTGLLGEVAVPAATARNAALAGTSAILREYAQQIRDSIARDGFYLRVPAGKPFYLYVTETIHVARTRSAAASSTAHEKR
jgi:hypothetical protein